MLPFTFFLIQLIDLLDRLLGHPSPMLCDLIGKSSWWNVRVWIVGQTRTSGAWELQGVFVAREQAGTVCRDESYFVAPVLLGESAPHESVTFPEAYRPILSEEG